MRRNIVLIIVLLLAACAPVANPPTPYIITATPPPTPEPTPTMEVEEWYSGCDINPHCDSDYNLVAVNENSDLDMGVAQSEDICVLIYDEGVPVQRCRRVDTPAPYGLYRWYYADATAIDGEHVFNQAAPDIREVANGYTGYTVNVSGMRGYIALDLVHQSVYVGLGRYVVGMEFAAIDLRTYDNDVSLPQSIDKICFLMLDNGTTMPLPPQRWVGGDADAPESVVYVLQFSSPHSFLLRCGVYLQHATVDGQIVFDRIFVSPVGADYGAGGYETTIR